MKYLILILALLSSCTHIAPPPSIMDSVDRCMALESVQKDHKKHILWLMYRESRFQVGVKNKNSTAVGLFQILKVNYGYFPHGKASIGNATEECQAGIRYIKDRYKTLDAAVSHWRVHKWY